MLICFEALFSICVSNNWRWFGLVWEPKNCLGLTGLAWVRPNRLSVNRTVADSYFQLSSHVCIAMCAYAYMHANTMVTHYGDGGVEIQFSLLPMPFRSYL